MTAPRLQRADRAPDHGIVHFGPGAFFRSFVAPYTQDAVAAEGGDWGITAVSLQSAEAAEALRPQGCVYTSVSLGPDQRTRQVITVLREVLVAPKNPEAVLRALCRSETRIVSLTITEKGYHAHAGTGALDVEAAPVQADLAQPDNPQTAVGYIVEALARRRLAGTGGFTVLSCDNLPANGRVTRRVVGDFARLRDTQLAQWIDANVRFPCTMVDRITPATTRADIDTLREAVGSVDLACVVHEPFRQWVIEDDFVAGRPAWHAAGAQMVADVAAHEVMKLRCLNGTHSALAYLGYLAGLETIAEAVAVPEYAALCDGLWQQDILPTVPPPQGQDLTAYVEALRARYRNPGIRHRTWQIAMDGSQKLPQRLLAPIADHRAEGHIPRGLCLAVAGWMRYVGGTDDQGAPIDVRDPLAEQLRSASDSASDPAGKTAAFLAIREIFPKAMAEDAALSGALTEAYARIARDGARGAVRAYVGQS